MTILFVCTGNICRSPMAEAYLRHQCTERGLTDVEVASAGTAAPPGCPASAQGRFVLWEEGVALDGHQSQPLSRELVESADLILAMTEGHRRQIESRFPESRGKVRTLLSLIGSPADVFDPYGGAVEDYAACFERMRPALEKLAEDLAAQAGA